MTISTAEEVAVLQSIIDAYDRGIDGLESGDEEAITAFLEERKGLLERVTRIAHSGWSLEPTVEIAVLCERVVASETRFVQVLRTVMQRLGGELAQTRARRGQVGKYR